MIVGVRRGEDKGEETLIREFDNSGSSVEKRGRVLQSAIVAILIALPPASFYFILFRHLVNLPLQDDYLAVLDFLNNFTTLQTGRVSYLITFQHMEYRQVFERVIMWLQLVLFRQIDFRALCVLGDAFVAIIGYVLWKMFLPAEENRARRLMMFLPVSLLLFQLQYVETLNWAMSSLQNFPGLAFSLASIYLLTLGGWRNTVLSVVFLFLAIASSAVLGLIPVGLLMLLVQRRWRSVAIWSISSLLCVAIYVFGRHSSVALYKSANLFSVAPVFFLSFAGSCVSFPLNGAYLGLSVLLCPMVGISLITFFVYVVRQRDFHRRTPAVAYSVLFLIVTAGAASIVRSYLGARQGLSSRFGIYSVLLLIFVWFVVADEINRRGTVKSSNPTFIAWIVFSAVFAVVMDIGGYRYLVNRNAEITQRMAMFLESGGATSPVVPLSGQPEWFNELDERAPLILRQSMQLNIYDPRKPARHY